MKSSIMPRKISRRRANQVERLERSTFFNFSLSRAVSSLRKLNKGTVKMLVIERFDIFANRQALITQRKKANFDSLYWRIDRMSTTNKLSNVHIRKYVKTAATTHVCRMVFNSLYSRAVAAIFF